MNQVVVIGSGTMGLDIAQVFAKAGLRVWVRDLTEAILSSAQAKLQNGLDKLVQKGKLDTAAAQSIFSAITFTTRLDCAADADLVVEAAVENLEIKKKIFSELDTLCRPETIFASNTSSISITSVAAATGRPDKFIGMHFFNPATVMRLVEVIRGANTSQETFDAVYALSGRIGKDPVEVAEAPGFVANKILIPMINESTELLMSGVASAKDIDQAMILGCGHPMGPLALGDLIGLDVCLAIMDTLLSETGDPKYRACLLMRKMVRGGLLGRKTGRGFFDYH